MIDTLPEIMPPVLHQIAEADTPSAVQIPNSKYGLIMWLVGRFGGGILIAAFAVYAWRDTNEEHKKLTADVLTAYREQASVQAKTVATMEQLTRTLERLTTDAERLHAAQPSRSMAGDR